MDPSRFRGRERLTGQPLTYPYLTLLYYALPMPPALSRCSHGAVLVADLGMAPNPRRGR
jgi:hypothetical protein